MNNVPKRKRNRLENYDYSLCGGYFITICTKDRHNCFWNNVGACIARPNDVKLSPYGKIAEEAVLNISSQYPAISVDQYVIMPNHVHLLLSICADENGRPMVAPTVSRVVQQMKGYVTKQIGTSVWQKSFHDHIIRGKEDYDEIARYIYENPLRWYDDELYMNE